MFAREIASHSEFSPGTLIRPSAFELYRDSEGSALIKAYRQAISWIVEGLMQAWAALEDWLWPRARISLVRKDDGYVLKRSDGLETAPVPFEGSAADIPTEVSALIKDGDVDVVLPSDELLVRTLDPLPAESRPYLDGIVRHQLERLAPWRAGDVLHSYQVAPAGPEDNRLIVTIAATARSLHRRLLDVLAALQPRKVRLLYRGADGGGDVVIDISGNTGLIAQTQRMRRALGWSAAALGLASLAGIALLTVAWQRTAGTLEATERDVQELRSKLASAGPSVPRGDRDVESIFARRLNTPFTVLALDSLSESLPDDTWLTELRIGEGRMRMTGTSRSVSKLVPLMQTSTSFAEATFFAPTTRLPDGQGDRFHLDVRLLPAGARKP
jgi:general secretion pathway protein L